MSLLENERDIFHLPEGGLNHKTTAILYGREWKHKVLTRIIHENLALLGLIS